MVNSRAKGAKCETDVKALLNKHTGLLFERTPGSGSGTIKGDLWLPNGTSRFCIEVKHYAESSFNDKIFTSKTNNFIVWWAKLQTQAKQNAKLPLLIFKYNRSKYFVSTNIKPEKTNKFVDISWLSCYTLLLEEWIDKEDIKWQ